MTLARRRPYGIYPLLMKTPIWFYPLGLGWVPGHHNLLLTHGDRKSGQLRRTVVGVVHYEYYIT